ncbi:hypothetical protein FPV67DRAFT_1422187 [Lyophyllum atratum]|nr:hypothetical protein FPV67DRAFT_1422187 [Lyophyllum atratum]
MLILFVNRVIEQEAAAVQSNDPPSDEPPAHAWTDASGHQVYFTAGKEDDPLAKSLARALQNAECGPLEFDEDEDEEDPLCSGKYPSSIKRYIIMPSSRISSDATAQELNEHLFGPASDKEWFPYPDKAMFLTDVLFSSPRLRFSRAQQKAVLSWARELGGTVPSYDKFRKTQATLLKEVGDPTARQESGRGNVWYLNDIGDAVKKDMANPHTRAGMFLYPEDAGNRLSEVWHGDKLLRDIPDEVLSPTIRHCGVIYYVNELVKRSNDRWFLPKRWITRNNGKEMMARGFHVIDTGSGLVVENDNEDTVEVSSFIANFVQILDGNSGIYPFAATCDGYSEAMPHPLRAKAGSRPVYSIPLAIFIDDVSGNKSKQWNKHFSCYMSNGALPRAKLEEEFHVRFVATSPYATPLEIMQGVRASIEKHFAEPIEAWDCENKEEVLLQTYALLFAGDNPMQAELCSCAGLGTNFFCRTCHAGGTREWKQSNSGFAEVLKEGEPRTSQETTDTVLEQILMALQPNVSTSLAEAVRLSGVKDALAQPIIDLLVKLGQDLRKTNPDGSQHSPEEVQAILTEELRKHQTKGNGIINPLLDMDGGVDIHKDTPTEILHTILLGVLKYYWGQTVWLLEKGKTFSLFQTRLNSIVEHGLNIPKVQADYMCQYRGGLIGKHFKTLSQIMAFAAYDLVPANVLDAWLILGRLTVLLWHTEIEDINIYISDLEACLNDFVDITCKCSPSILISKPKFHFLLHLPFYIRRFGPAVLFSTERYEAYNAVFRACSIYSNRLTPSRDIAWAFAGIDRVKHIVTGGWWKDTGSKKWVCASRNIMRHILHHPEFAAMVGLPTKVARQPGRVTTYPKSRKSGAVVSQEVTVAFGDSLAGKSTSNEALLGLQYRTAIGINCCSGDFVKIGQDVIVRAEQGPFSPLSFGTLREILLPVKAVFRPDEIQITVQLFRVESEAHPRLHMPVVSRTPDHVVLSPKDIECSVNLQHNCHRGQCTASGLQTLHQEREVTTKFRTTMKHTDNDSFVVNTHSLHNYRQIRSAIPTFVPRHSFSVDDRGRLHHAAASQIRDKSANPNDAEAEDQAPPMLLQAGDEDLDVELDEHEDPGEQGLILDAPAFQRPAAPTRMLGSDQAPRRFVSRAD